MALRSRGEEMSETATVAEPAPAETGAVAPLVAIEPPESDELIELREDLAKRERPWHLGLRTVVFALSLVAFAWTMREAGWVGVGIIVAVLLFHELGHFVAMRAFGYQNMQVFFIPFLGAAVSGRAREAVGWQAGIISLAGPVPGLLIGAALQPDVVPGTWQAMLVVTLIFVNGLNLLPLVPLDGGRLLSTVLFSRHIALELLALIAGGIGLMLLLEVKPAIMAGVIGGLLVNRVRLLEKTKSLRTLDADFAGPTSALPTDSLAALLRAANELLAKSPFDSRRGRASLVAELHETARQRPAGWRESVVLFAVWAACAGLAYTSWQDLKNPELRWREESGPGWTARFPGPTLTKTTPKPAFGIREERETVSRVNGKGEFGIITASFNVPALHFFRDRAGARATIRNMAAETARITGARIASQRPVEWKVREALETSLVLPSGVVMDMLHIADGNRVYVLLAVDVKDKALRTEFARSFKTRR